MKTFELKYGLNPVQKPATVYMKDGGELPFEILNGRPGYINFMDAMNSWQLVRGLQRATGKAAAASFKHVSPAGAAVASTLTETERAMYFVEQEDVSDIASAYIRARGADRLCSYGDWVALSCECDETCAAYLKREVSDGIIAPGYTPVALEILKSKKRGNFNIIQMSETYEPAPQECRDVFGITFEQGYNNYEICEELLNNIVTENKNLPGAAKTDLLVSLLTLKYTQSNSVCYVRGGQTIGVGAGQQSRVHCTRLAGSKADTWWLRQHPRVLDLPFKEDIKRPARDNAIDIYISDEPEVVLAEGAWQDVFNVRPDALSTQDKHDWIAKMNGVSLGSDAFFPFGDNIERAERSGVEYIAEPGGSIRDDDVINVANKYNMTMCFTGMRLFHH